MQPLRWLEWRFLDKVESRVQFACLQDECWLDFGWFVPLAVCSRRYIRQSGTLLVLIGVQRIGLSHLQLGLWLELRFRQGAPFLRNCFYLHQLNQVDHPVFVLSCRVVSFHYAALVVELFLLLGGPRVEQVTQVDLAVGLD